VSAIAVCLVAFLGFVPRPSEVERRFRDYMQAVDRQELGEWKTAIGSRFDFEIVAVRGDRLIARIVETNRLYSALDVGRLVVSEYVLDGDAIRETQVLEVHETGRPWDEARREPVVAVKPPRFDPDELCGVVPVDYRQPYDVREIIAYCQSGQRSYSATRI